MGTSEAATGHIYGNQWRLNIASKNAGLNVWGNNDSYHLSISGGATFGIGFNVSSANNEVFISLNNAVTPVVDSSTCQCNKIY